jgi:NAD(P)-dependent dehydrogenase (short-subunit alcohol dehydrogenase family)
MTTDLPNQNEPTVQTLFDLSGKTSLITGASGYLGRAMARALAEAGSRVVVTSRDLDRAQSVADALPDPDGLGHVGLVVDQMDESSIQRGFAQAVEKTGRIDILVNNGNQAVAGDLADVTPEEFNRQLANATGYFLLARLLHDHAVGQERPASVVMLGSMYGMVGSYPDAYEGICPASPVGYHALKGGIIHMTRHLAVYWAGDGVRVNCLSPGPFPGPKVSGELVERLSSKCPMRRMGLPHELKGAVVFLASDAASYMTGQNLVIDGGWTSW